MTRRWRRAVYLTLLILTVLAWIWLGRFEAVEAPYVGF